MKYIKSKKPYLIKDTKKHTEYSALLYGLVSNQIEPVVNSLKSKIDVNKLYLQEKIRCGFSEFENENFDLIPALLYAEQNCSSEIYQEIMKTLKLSDDLKAKIVFKALSKVKPSEDVSENKELQEIIKSYVNKNNINKFFKIQRLDDPLGMADGFGGEDATFLHVAAATLNHKLIEQLIDLGANVNLKTKRNYSQTPAHVVVSETSRKEDQSNGAKSLIALLNANANFYLKDLDKKDVWSRAIDRFNATNLKNIFKTFQPSDIKNIKEIQRKSSSLYDFWQKQSNGFNNYPLIDDIFKYEKLNVSLGEGFNEVKDVQKFFKNKSLKSALSQRYGISSSRLCSIFTKKLFVRDENKVFIDLSFLQKVDLAYNLVSKNTSDFLEVLEKDSASFESLSSDIMIYNDYKDVEEKISSLVKMLSKIYNSNQIKNVITDDKIEFEDSVDDIINMYNEYPLEMDLIFKRTKFSEINSLQKLHDFLAKETNSLEQENFKLEQESHKQELKKLSKVKMPSGYGIKLAEENHELIRWGASMGHCVGGGTYAREVKQGKTIIMAITKDKEPKYCVEISPEGRILQVQGKSYTVPALPIMEEFVKELKSIGVLNSKEKASNWISR